MKFSHLLIASLVTVFFLFTDLLAQEELPSISFSEIVDIINDRCPCAEIGEEEENEDSSSDEIEDKSASFCRSRIANPGKFRQGARFLNDLGILEFEEGESLKDVFGAFKEARKDCKKGKGNSNGNGNGKPE